MPQAEATVIACLLCLLLETLLPVAMGLVPGSQGTDEGGAEEKP